MTGSLHMRQLFILPICLLAFSSCAQEDTAAAEPDIQRYYYKLGTIEIAVKKTTFAGANTSFLIQLHDDENTAEEAAITFLKESGGTLLSIENSGRRYIHFSLNGRKHMFDPNRMFTQKGIQQNLGSFRCYTVAAAKSVAGFGNFLLGFISDTAVLIAVHNNTESKYSIYSYKTDKTLKQDAEAVHINPAQDGDDFLITTDTKIYKKAAERNLNAVLQKARVQNNDGSLSFYYGRRNRSYINVEAQSGHFAEQLQMLQTVQEILNKK